MKPDSPDFPKNENHTLTSLLPSALGLFDMDTFHARIPVLFLDFDGTLAPIVSNPEDARLTVEMTEVLANLLKRHTCVILTGRDRADIEKRIDLPGIIFAGSHGYEIKGRELEWIYEDGLASIAALDDAQKNLEAILSEEAGVVIERKKFAIAVHYRHVKEEREQVVVDKIQRVIERYKSHLKPGPGKKVLELKPNCEWNKGKALEWLMNRMNFDLNRYLPVFIGDDLTDEDGFSVVRENGIGIIVSDDPERYSQACYSLSAINEVYDFLHKLSQSE